MNIWRLVKAEHADTAFDGEGAAVAGGRWNNAGTRVVYVSQSLSLAALEVLVHTGQEGLHVQYRFFEITVRGSVPVETIEHLPEGWGSDVAPESAKKIGSDWVAKKSSAVLRVPSVIVPGEFNFLLNPAHRDFRKLKIGKPKPFSFDTRLLK